MATKRSADSGEISIMEVQRGSMDFCILGTTPLICNRMSEKSKRTLLLPPARKNTAAKESSLKHDPLEEFRASPYTISDDKAPTFIALLPTMFKKAMASAALDMPGAKKAQIGRLVSVEWERIPVWGMPRIFMAVTRSADIGKTPDVRTRVIVPEWACRLSVDFIKPNLREQGIANLLAAAGIQSGVGDWRQEKGSGSYGCFKLVGSDDPDFVRITKTMGRKAQQEAMAEPVAYDDDTSEMLGWFDVETKRRGFRVAA